MPGVERRDRDGARRQHRVRVGHARPQHDYDQQSPEGTPGKEGDVIHVFRYNGRPEGDARRHDRRAGPRRTPPPQDFPPTAHRPGLWPRDLAISPDGKTLLAALNLAHRAAIIDTGRRRSST